MVQLIFDIKSVNGLQIGLADDTDDEEDDGCALGLALAGKQRIVVGDGGTNCPKCPK